MQHNEKNEESSNIVCDLRRGNVSIPAMGQCSDFAMRAKVNWKCAAQNSHTNTFHQFFNLYHHFVVRSNCRVQRKLRVVNTLCVCERNQHVRHSRMGMWVNILQKQNAHGAHKMKSIPHFVGNKTMQTQPYVPKTNSIIYINIYWWNEPAIRSCYLPQKSIYLHRSRIVSKNSDVCCHTRCGIHSNILFDIFRLDRRPTVVYVWLWVWSKNKCVSEWASARSFHIDVICVLCAHFRSTFFAAKLEHWTLNIVNIGISTVCIGIYLWATSSS